MKRKLTTLERRAADACEAIRTNGGRYHFQVIWRHSRTWGMIPSIEYRGEKCAMASGCGYDKLSAVVVEMLQFLYPRDTEEWRKICNASGAGIRTLISVLGEVGWTLTHVYDGRSEDGFTIERSVQS